MRSAHISPATLQFLRTAVSESRSATPLPCLRSHRIRSGLSIVQSPPYCRYGTCFGRQFSQSSIRPSPSPSLRPPRTLDSLIENPPKTHYDFFPSSIPEGPPPSGPFSIDLPAVRREFLRLQALAHPDRLPPQRRPTAQALSAQINDAYRTLQSPLKRAEYLLEVRGARAQADDEHVLGQAEGDEEILMEVMEAREEAEEAVEDEEVRGLRAVNQERIDAVIQKLEDAFRKDDLVRAKREAVRLSYWVGVEDRLREGNSMH